MERLYHCCIIGMNLTHGNFLWECFHGRNCISDCLDFYGMIRWSISKKHPGALVQYNHDKGFFDAYIDWRGIQSEITREAFNIVFHGECKPKGMCLL